MTPSEVLQEPGSLKGEVLPNRPELLLEGEPEIKQQANRHINANGTCRIDTLSGVTEYFDERFKLFIKVSQ